MLHTICNSCWFVATHFFYLSGTAQYVTLSQYFYFWHTKSDPRDLWPMRHFNRLMRKHDLMNILTIKDKTWKSERPGCPGTWMSKRLGCPGTWMSWDLEVRKTWMSERPGCPGTWMSGDLDVRGPGCPGPECPGLVCPGPGCLWVIWFTIPFLIVVATKYPRSSSLHSKHAFSTLLGMKPSKTDSNPPIFCRSVSKSETKISSTFTELHHFMPDQDSSEYAFSYLRSESWKAYSDFNPNQSITFQSARAEQLSVIIDDQNPFIQVSSCSLTELQLLVTKSPEKCTKSVSHKIKVA